ncbi:MAG: DUF885 domain-containing protein [Anaerolineales bacterium]|nr:DUF885 domain-containing protein [Anaerolineales bacterium]
MSIRSRALIISCTFLLLLASSCNRAPAETDAPVATTPVSTIPATIIPTDTLLPNPPTTDTQVIVQPSPTAEPTDAPAPDATAIPAIDTLRLRLQGLALTDFFELSYREILLRYPETVLEVGLEDIYGVQIAELNNISDAYNRETYAIMALILDVLHTYDRSALSAADQISYDVYEWYLEDQLAGEEFMYYDFPLTYFPTISVPLVQITFFTDIHPLASYRDALDYITRLSLVDTKFTQLLEGVDLRQQAGVIPPKFSLQWAIGSLQEVAYASATQTPFYAAFAEKVNALPDLDEAGKAELLAAAEAAIQESVLPAYQQVLDYVMDLQKRAPLDDGVWQYPAGDSYYAYLLHHHTSTSLTASEIHLLGQQEVARLQAEVRDAGVALGYPPDASMAEIFQNAERDGGYVAGNEVLDTYTALIAGAEARLDAAFDIRPQAQVIVVGDQYGGFYIPGSLDGSRPGMFYANVSGASEPYFGMPTLAYHEAVPGHHFQISLAMEADLPSFRKGLIFTAYAEGWALYAEQLAWELGWYSDDPYGNLGRLQALLFRAARLVVDTGIHTQGWTRDQATAYLAENIGQADWVGPWEHQAARYVVYPGQATSYMVGYLKMVELRQRAMDALGDQFDLVEYHRLVLSNGSMPLSVLENVVDAYILSKSNP